MSPEQLSKGELFAIIEHQARVIEQVTVRVTELEKQKYFVFFINEKDVFDKGNLRKWYLIIFLTDKKEIEGNLE